MFHFYTFYRKGHAGFLSWIVLVDDVMHYVMYYLGMRMATKHAVRVITQNDYNYKALIVFYDKCVFIDTLINLKSPNAETC